MSKDTSNKERKEAFKIIKDLSSKSRTVMFNLGWMYEQGICTKQDSKAALAAYKISADKNSPHALYRLNQLHQQGYLVERDEQLASDYRQRSINASKKITFHNMMSTFIDLPYIKNLQMAVPEKVQVSFK
jgi:TPR repeat protein